MRPARVTALLGPTNTGKTHRAIERMLEYRSGMFGLPLRLLAREVYDRVCARKDRGQVALVTGEEKIVPEGARYFICTVEAMPLDVSVAFVAVDEVQLAGHRQRGHVFTDRILNCRGLAETVFLGSDSMTGLLMELVPGITIERAERFSTLTMEGPHRLPKVPSRSAVVAFSAEKVYELAERLKAVHGGTAVVLGALSPRTRNAQVELYQSGDVKHLVATDAIGMGLNLDLQHVALAALRKYDGRSHRDLTAAEVAQIAGRAGRYKTPGTFGTLRPLEMPDDLVEAVETHRFPAVRSLFWRNTGLDYTTLETLAESLEREPPHRALIQTRGEDDQHVLEVLGRDPAVRARVTGPAWVERLWEVCQVPDFRKTLTDSHVHLLQELALHLLGDDAVLPEDWVDERIARLDRTDGDIETLMGRIAWIRTWTYVTYRKDWVADTRHWQERTRAIEDRLSDALHEALTARFVESRQHWGIGMGPVRLEDSAVFLGEHLVGRLDGFEFTPETGITRSGQNLVRSALAALLANRLSELEQAPDTELFLDDEHRIVWRGGVLGTLKAGPDLVTPAVSIHRLALLSGPDKNRVHARVERWVRATVERLLAPVRESRVPPGPVRGLLYAMERGLGSIPVSEVKEEVRALTEADRNLLARLGIRIGRYTLYVPRLLKPDMVRVRARLFSVFGGHVPTLAPPDPSKTATVAQGPGEFWTALGFGVVGPLAVRADVLESCAAEVRKLSKSGPFEAPDAVRSRLGCDAELAGGFLVGLGCTEVGEGMYRMSGPPKRPSRARRGGRGRGRGRRRG